LVQALTNGVGARQLIGMVTVAKAEPGAAAKKGRKARGARKKRHSRGLLLVGLFKLSKAIFFGAAGIGALKLLHRDVGDLVMRLTSLVPLDPNGHLASVIMDKADLVGNHQLRQVGYSSLAYACVCLVEGVGLLMEKVWAEYVTVVLTVLALPWEIYELVREPSPYRAGLLVLNVMVLLYLLWLIRRMRQKLAGRAAAG
jgi:uncharacterized membrane protein (DUF2068 family)